jgi:HK97 family phage major capsid protein
MLQSVKLQKRQSEIRTELAVLAGKESPSEDELRSIDALDKEYSANEAQYRAALIAEDEERSEAGKEMETRSEKEYRELVDAFELRQVASALDEGTPLSGQTAEVVQEMRSHGGYQGIPIPLAALELRAGETIASGTPDPIQTKPIIDRLFPASVVGRMGGSLINITAGQIEWPVATGGAVVGWGDGELANVGAATQYTTVDKSLSPDYHMGAQMTLSRKALKQSGKALEQAIRRDLNAAIATELDRVVFLGAGSSGEPLGIVAGAGTYGFDVNDVSAAASYAAFRAAAVEFLTRNAATSFKDIRIVFRHELLNTLDDTVYETGDATTEFDRIVSRYGSVMTTGNALAAPTGGPPAESSAVMTTSVGGVPPFFVGIWGGVDLIRDPYTKAASGQLVLTGIVTADVTASRTEQVGILTGLQ